MSLNRKRNLERIRSKLKEIQRKQSSRKVDSALRRKMLKASGLLAAGISGGLLNSAAGLKVLASDSFKVSSTTETYFELDRDKLVVDDMEVDEINNVKVARTAEEIQPAIDELVKRRDDGSQGGVVKLLPKVYKPYNTIYLKKGVMLEGAQASRIDRTEDDQEIRSTVISTENMGSDPPHYHAPLKNDDQRHPHYPVIMNYRTPPLELDDREPTEEEKQHWGHHIGLKDIIIDGSKKQKYEINFELEDFTEDEYKYFNVYDAVFLSRSNGFVTRNVETKGFLGYGMVVIGCRSFRDWGSLWQGGATDLHHEAVRCLTPYAPDNKVYPEGMMDFEAYGPAPVVKMHLRGGHQLRSGGWSNNRIKSTGYKFVGSKKDWKNGDAPFVNPSDSDAVFVHDGHGTFAMENYTIEGHGQDVDGMINNHHSNTLNGVHIKNVRTAFPGFARGSIDIYNSKITDAKKGVHFGVRTTNLYNVEINAEIGISFSGRANAGHSYDGITFNCDIGVKGSNGSDRGPVIFNFPDFTNCETPFSDPDSWDDHLSIHNPTGLTDEEHPLK